MSRNSRKVRTMIRNGNIASTILCTHPKCEKRFSSYRSWAQHNADTHLKASPPTSGGFRTEYANEPQTAVIHRLTPRKPEPVETLVIDFISPKIDLLCTSCDNPNALPLTRLCVACDPTLQAIAKEREEAAVRKLKATSGHDHAPWYGCFIPGGGMDYDNDRFAF